MTSWERWLDGKYSVCICASVKTPTLMRAAAIYWPQEGGTHVLIC